MLKSKLIAVAITTGAMNEKKNRTHQTVPERYVLFSVNVNPRLNA